MGRRLISWQCKKQTIVATSSTEAEYVAAASCCAQVLWIQNQLLDYGFNFMNTKIFIDNQSTICIVKNPVFHQRTKHIEIRHHFIRDANEKNLIQVLKIHTDENVADLLTKAFDGPRFEYLVVHIGMVDMLFCGILFSCDCRSSILLLVVILSAGRLVSAGCTMFLLVVILSAGRLVSAGRTMVLLVVILSAGCTMLLLVVILSAGRLVSAGCTMFLLVVILSAGRLVSAGRTMVLLVVILSAGCSVSAGSYGFCCCFRVHDGGHPSAGGFIYADRVYVPAVCMVSAVGCSCWLNLFMLLELFMLPIHLFMLLDCLILLVGWSMPLVTWILLVVSIPADLLLLVDFLPAGLKKCKLHSFRFKFQLYGAWRSPLACKSGGQVDFSLNYFNFQEYEYICRRLEKDRLLSAQYNLFRPKPVITEPPSKRQRVERASSQPSHVPAATTQPADDHDSAWWY
ncbi:hypothetical protein Tco_0045213 [Tanacetum coccineum]